jgi:hypothetical protein
MPVAVCISCQLNCFCCMSLLLEILVLVKVSERDVLTFMFMDGCSAYCYVSCVMCKISNSGFSDSSCIVQLLLVRL